MLDAALLRRRHLCGLLLPALMPLAPTTRPKFETGTLSPLPPVPGSSHEYAYLQLPNGLRCVVGCGGDRCQLALTVRCGSLHDDGDADGLAHLTEHLTLAADPAGIGGLIDTLDGDINAFTRDETTTFYFEFAAEPPDDADVATFVANVDGVGADAAGATDVFNPSSIAASSATDAAASTFAVASTGSGADASAAALRQQLSESARRFGVLFSPLTAPNSASGWAPGFEGLAAVELRRIHAEFARAASNPSRALQEVAQLKARAQRASAWRRLGRGDQTSLPETDLLRLMRRSAELRRRRYVAETATLALVSPLPCAEGAAIVAGAFASMEAAASTRRPVWGRRIRLGSGSTAPASASASDRTASEVQVVTDGSATVPPRLQSRVEPVLTPPFGRLGAPPVALRSFRRWPLLTLAWCVPFADAAAAVATARHKPFALLGDALSSPHAGSLADVLRAERLSPLAVEVEPVITSRIVASTTGWAIWQLELLLLPESQHRWGQACAIARRAVARLGNDGVPLSVAVEAGTGVESALRYSSRPPTAVELSIDLQLEPAARLAVASGRSFTDPFAVLAAAATRTARQVSPMKPVVTLWATPGTSFSKNTGSSGSLDDSSWSSIAASTSAGRPQLFAAVRFFALPEESMYSAPARAAAGTALPLRAAPPPNWWVTQPMHLSPRVMPSLRVPRTYGLGVVQMPGCVAGSFEIASKAALSAVGCDGQRRPFCVALLQMLSDRPAGATAEQAAAAELWRFGLQHRLGRQGALAARAGLKWELAFNSRGVRIAVSGPASRLRELLALVVQEALHDDKDSVMPATAEEVAAVRRAALAALPRAEPAVSAQRAALLSSLAASEVESELAALWGSVHSAELLVAGDMPAVEAATLRADVASQLKPLLCCRQGDELGPGVKHARTPKGSPPSRDDLASALEWWMPLLYRPNWQPQPLAQNLCLVPSLGSTLDQCGA